MSATRFVRHCSPGVAVASVMIAAAVGLSGCGSSGAAGPATSHNGTTQPAAGSSRPTSAAPASSQTASRASSSTSAAPTTASLGGVAAGSGFCQQAAAAQAAQADSARAFGAEDTPAGLEKLEKQALDTLSGFVATAPSAIKGDVQVLVTADQKFYAALAAAHFDVRKLNPDTFSQLQTSEFTKAVTSITAYLAKDCGISANPTG